MGAKAKVVVLESAKSTGFEGLSLGAPPLQENGLCQEYETQIDCNSDPESVRLSLGPDFIVRKLQIYSHDKNKCQAFTAFKKGPSAEAAYKIESVVGNESLFPLDRRSLTDIRAADG